MMTDPIADMLTRIRNALRIERPFVDVPHSFAKLALAGVLQREGYIWDYEILGDAPHSMIRVNLKYGPNGERVIQHIDRVSTPGCRVYSKVAGLKPVLQGMGITILTTSQGLLSDRECLAKKLGGEVLCRVW